MRTALAVAWDDYDLAIMKLSKVMDASSCDRNAAIHAQIRVVEAMRVNVERAALEAERSDG